MKRHSKKQAVRTDRSFTEIAVDVFNTLHNAIGNGVYVLALAMLVALGGGFNAMLGPSSDANDRFENIPDNISEACWAQRVRSGLRETTVDRYEREQMEQALKAADKCADENK